MFYKKKFSFGRRVIWHFWDRAVNLHNWHWWCLVFSTEIILKNTFLAHLARLASFVCLSVCKLFTFSPFSPELLPISTKLSTKHSWLKEIQVCSNERPGIFPRGHNNEIAEIHWQNLRIFFFRTNGPISTKLGTKHTWVKGIQVFF